MKKVKEPTTAKGWKRRVKKIEADFAARLAEIRAEYRVSLETRVAGHERDAAFLKAHVFDLTSAQSRYVKQDNAIRKLLGVWGTGSVKAPPTLRAIAKVLDAPT